MRTYHLFNIKYKYLLEDKNDKLYIVLSKMYQIRNVEYEVSLFNRICKLIDIDVISSYLEKVFNVRKHHNKYLIDNYLIEINRSNIVIKTSVNIPDIFKILNIYSKDFFVIDFKNQDYFFLDDILKQLKI